MHIVVHIVCDFVDRCHSVCSKAYVCIVRSVKGLSWNIYATMISDDICYICCTGIYQAGSDTFAAYERGGSGYDIGI